MASQQRIRGGRGWGDGGGLRTQTRQVLATDQPFLAQHTLADRPLPPIPGAHRLDLSNHLPRVLRQCPEGSVQTDVLVERAARGEATQHRYKR
jgi:hypothetical protein